ncbi:MAG: hypothetical protein EHM19_11590, partial [Candidatus Latescibacterota bacterium]
MSAPQAGNGAARSAAPKRKSLLLLVGASHKSAPLSTLESIALPPDAIGDLLPKLRERARLEEALLLSTCNRTEIYAVTADPTEAGAELERWMLDIARG